MSGYIDMHCHILPEVDDGAESIEETVQMLQIAYRGRNPLYYSHTASSSKAGERKSEST